MTAPNILVRDYMHPLAIYFRPDQRVEDVVEGLIRHKMIGAPVLDENQQMVGFITEQDCIKEMLNDSYYGQDHQQAADIMRRETISITPNMNIMQLAEDMMKRRPKLYPVCENGKVIGMITRADVLRALSIARKTSRQ